MGAHPSTAFDLHASGAVSGRCARSRGPNSAARRATPVPSPRPAALQLLTCSIPACRVRIPCCQPFLLLEHAEELVRHGVMLSAAGLSGSATPRVCGTRAAGGALHSAKPLCLAAHRPAIQRGGAGLGPWPVKAGLLWSSRLVDCQPAWSVLRGSDSTNVCRQPSWGEGALHCPEQVHRQLQKHLCYSEHGLPHRLALVFGSEVGSGRLAVGCMHMQLGAGSGVQRVEKRVTG